MDNNQLYSKLRVVLRLCYFFGIAAPFGSSMIYKFIATCFILISIFGYIHSVMGKASELFYDYILVVKVVDQAAAFFLTLTTETSVILCIFIYSHKFQKYLLSMVNFDSKIQLNPCPFGKLFWICLVLIHFTKILTLSLDSYAWLSTVGFEKYKFYVIRNIQFYKLSVNLFLVFWITVEIRKRFQVINELLKTFFRDASGDATINRRKDNIAIVEENNKLKKIQDIIHLHNQICDVLDEHNQIWGLVSMFSIVFLILYTVQYTVIMIYFTIMGGQLNGQDFGFNLQFASISWIVQNFVILFALAAAGEGIIQETDKTKTICCSLINSLDSSQHHYLKEKFEQLARQNIHRNPRLLASGFFVVNLNMMGFIVNSITSYIIIAVQMIQSPK